MVFPKLPRSFTRKLHKTENKRERTIQGNFLIPVPPGSSLPDDFPRRVSLGEILVDAQTKRILSPVNGLASLTADRTHFQIKQDGAWRTDSPLQITSYTYETFLEICKVGALASLDFEHLTLDQYFSSFKKDGTFDIFLAPYARYNYLPFSNFILDEMPEAFKEFESLIRKIFPNAKIHNEIKPDFIPFKHPDGIPEFFISQKTGSTIRDALTALDSRTVMYLGPETIYHVLRMAFYNEPFTRRHLYVCLVDRKGRMDTESRFYLLTNGQSLDFVIKNFDSRYKIASFQSMYEGVNSLDIRSLGNFDIYNHSILLLYERLPVIRNSFACIDCYECNTYCPTNANPIAVVKNNSEEFVKSQCIQCGICTLYCPSGIDIRSKIQGLV